MKRIKWISASCAAAHFAVLAGTSSAHAQAQPKPPAPAPAPAKQIKPATSVKLPPVASGSADGDAAMSALEAQYAAERTSDLLAGLARYADELTALQKSLLAAGDTAAAARVQLELDRVLPAVGPVKAEPAADDFSIFEETDPASKPLPLAAGTVTPADLESLLKALLPPAPGSSPIPAATGSGAGSGSGSGGSPSKPDAASIKTGRRLLKMASAQLNGSWIPDYSYLYWITTGRRAVWTIEDLPAVPCKVVLRYACDDKLGGGKLTVRLGEAKTEIDVPPTGSWTRYRDLPVGTLKNAAARADLVVEVASLKTGATALMDLKAVMVIPSEQP